MMVILIVRVVSYDVRLTHRPPPTKGLLLDALTLLARQAAEILFVVVGMRPDTPRWVGGGVYEELMRVLGIEGADPAFGERTVLVFHAAAVVGGDASIAATRHSEMGAVLLRGRS